MRYSHTKVMLLTIVFASSSVFCGDGAPEKPGTPTTKPLTPANIPSSPSSVSTSSTPDATPRKPYATGKRLAIVTAASVLGFESSTPKASSTPAHPAAPRPSPATPSSFFGHGTLQGGSSSASSAPRPLITSTPMTGPRASTPAYPAAPQPSPSTPTWFFRPETPFGGSPSASSAPRPSRLKTATSMVMAVGAMTPSSRREAAIKEKEREEAHEKKELIKTYVSMISEIQSRVRTAGRLEQHMFWFGKLVEVLEKAQLYREFTRECSAKLEEKKAPLCEALMQAEKDGDLRKAGEIRLEIDRLQIGRAAIAQGIIKKNELMLNPHVLFQYFQVQLGIETATNGDNSSPYDEIIKNYEDEIERLGSTIVRTPGF